MSGSGLVAGFRFGTYGSDFSVADSEATLLILRLARPTPTLNPGPLKPNP